MKILSSLVAAICISLFGCSKPPAPAEPVEKSSTEATTTSASSNSYLGASFQARASAQRQLGEVQRERLQQVKEEKEFSRKPSSEPEP